MGSDRQTFLIIGVLSLFLVGGCQSAKTESASQDSPPLSESPELRMKKIHLQSFDQDILQWELFSPEAEGFTSQNFIRSRDLEVRLYEEGKKSTDIYSDYGLLITDTAKSEDKKPPVEVSDGLALNQGDMYLNGNVVVVSTEGTRLETDWLWFHQEESIITSTAPVQVVRADSITKGIGLRATSDLSSVTIFDQKLIIKSTDTANESP